MLKITIDELHDKLLLVAVRLISAQDLLAGDGKQLREHATRWLLTIGVAPNSQRGRASRPQRTRACARSW